MKENSAVFGSQAGAGLPRARARFLAQAIQLEEGRHFRVINTSIYLTILLLVALMIWAGKTELNEIAISHGKVVPAGLIHNVQHLEGGIVSAIPVRNGDRVSAGDLLLRFSPAATESDLEQARIRNVSLQLELERLQAILEDRKPDFSVIGAGYPELADKQMTIYQAQLHSLRSELDVADARIRQRKSELIRQRNQSSAIAEEVRILEQQVAIRAQSLRQKIISRTEYLATQSRLAEVQSEQRKISDGIGVAETALEEARRRRLEILAKFNKEIEIEAGEVAGRLAEVEQSLVRLTDRVQRLDVRAPVSGIVQGMVVTIINAVVEPGQVILRIVPVDDELIVESRISPEDIGHVHNGQPADVKFDSYDHARFGSVSGKVRRISASTYLDETGTPYYRAEIGLAKNYLADEPQHLRIIPGMTVRADIRTGSKSILDYLLRPISRGFSTAFGER